MIKQTRAQCQPVIVVTQSPPFLLPKKLLIILIICLLSLVLQYSILLIQDSYTTVSYLATYLALGSCIVGTYSDRGCAEGEHCSEMSPWGAPQTLRLVQHEHGTASRSASA